MQRCVARPASFLPGAAGRQVFILITAREAFFPDQMKCAAAGLEQVPTHNTETPMDEGEPPMDIKAAHVLLRCGDNILVARAAGKTKW